MDKTSIKLKHIKLDKLAYSETQCIFKSKIQTYTNDLLSTNSLPDSLTTCVDYNKFNTIFYAKESTTDSKNNKDLYKEYELLDFDEVEFLYKNENKTFTQIAHYLNNTTDYYKQYFNKYLIPEENTQTLIYYKNLEKPIDIININNIGYFLSPLNTKKHLAITNQNQMINNSNQNIIAMNKPKYAEMYQYMLNRTNSYPEVNAIPIYDLGFNFIDTINFSSYTELSAWLIQNNFQKISSNITYIKNEYNSIKLKELLSTLYFDQDYSVKYSTNNYKVLLADLLSRISPLTSINKYTDKYGLITKLNTNYYSSILSNNILSSTFNLSYDEIKEIFNNTYKDLFTVYDYPQNTLYFSNLNKSLNLNTIHIYDKISTYLNFVNLKNTQAPNYEYDIEFPEKMFDIINYIDESQYITITDDNKMLENANILNLSSNIGYSITYISGIFYVKDLVSEVYQNNLAFIFYPCGILTSNISSEIALYKKEYNINTNNDVILSTHVYEEIYNTYNISSEIKSLDLLSKTFLNKARGIDFNIPPLYIYKIGENLNVHYTDAADNYTKNIYFPSGLVSCVLMDSDKIISSNILTNDFPNTYQTPTVSGTVSTVNTVNPKLAFYFNTNTLSRKIYGNCTFKIKRISIFDDIENYIDNYIRMLYFDIDKNKSLSYHINKNSKSYYNNKVYNNPIKSVVSTILEKCITADNDLASTDIKYAKNYEYRMSGKIDNYLAAFNEFHVENNRIAETGKLNGLRIYEHLGKMTDSSLWISYKYSTLKSNNILKSFENELNLPFNIYSIYRFLNNMELDNLGNIDYKGIEKIKNMADYPKITPYVFLDETHNYLCSSCFNCKVPISAGCCHGYCTFPYNHIDKLYLNNTVFPNGVYWSLSSFINYKKTLKYTDLFINDNILRLSVSKSYEQYLIAKTDLNINDDIEIYYIPHSLSDLDVINLFDDLRFKKYTYKSIFQGFGGLTSSGIQNYKSYLMINNPKNYTQYKFKALTIEDYFYPLFKYIPDSLLESTSPVSSLFYMSTLKTYLTDFIKCDKFKHEYFYDRQTGKLRELTEDELKLLNLKINDLLLSSNYSFLISGAITSEGIDKSYTQINLYTKYAIKNPIEPYPQYTYREVATTNLLDMLKTNKQYSSTIKNFANKNTAVDAYILDEHGFVISKYSPFNGPHTVISDTKLKGLVIENNKILDIESILEDLNNNIEFSEVIPPFYDVIIRIVNWWDDTPKCTGNIIVKPTETALNNNKNLSTVTNIINEFDFSECIDENNIIKLNQNSYKKSNIYSIKIKNSGLSEEYNPFINLKQFIILKDYLNLDNNIRILYELEDWNTIQYNLNYNKNINKEEIIEKYYNELYYIYTYSTDPFIKGNPPEKNNPFTEKLTYFYSSTNGYYRLNTDLVNSIIVIKNNLRKNLETAIKNSVSRYMPVETKLWQIIYEDN